MSAAEPLVLWAAPRGDAAAWSANAAVGSGASVATTPGTDGTALRFAFDLAGHGAWALARCGVAAALPPHYVVTMRIRGESPPVELQLKLIDPTGASVWWWRRRTFVATPGTQVLVFYRASLDPAWGPAGIRGPDQIGAVELAVTANADTHGVLWIEDLRIEPRAPVKDPARVATVRASSCMAGSAAAHAVDADASTSWRPAPTDAAPWLELDLGAVREWGGLVVDFAGERAPAARVLGSADGSVWTALVDAPAGGGPRRWLETGPTESRYVRLELPAGGAVRSIAIVPIELAASPARYASVIARGAPRGWFPRHLLDEQGYWAVVGGDGDERKALLGEDGAVEVDAEAFTLEPFLRVDSALVTWADVESRLGLADGALPLPFVEWTRAPLRLRIAPFVTGAPGASTLIVRYELMRAAGATTAGEPVAGGAATAGEPAAADVRLLVAIRPFQVTPAWQSLNLVGGIAPLTRIARAGARVRVNDTRDVIAITRPDAFEATDSDTGTGAILGAAGSARDDADDPLGLAQGALAFDVPLVAGEPAVVVVAVPLFDTSPPVPAGLAAPEAAAWSTARRDEVTTAWHARLAGIPITLPPSAAAYEETLRASVGWILVNREGPRIQPGPRAYRRSWIRDGTLTGTALAEMGYAEEARAFLRWYAPHQLADGRVPCAIDHRGIDHAVEHDSHGQLAWGIVEVFRLTADRAFLDALWPHAARAVDAIAALRAERLAAADAERCRYGLLPESISHEGYAASPVHSYWDDFFAVRALTDAAHAARVLGDVAGVARITALRDAMRGDLHASIACTMERHHLDVLPGSVELADFDPTSTAIAFDPCEEADRLPRAALERTFERYWQEFATRRRTPTGPAYAAYEIRNVVAFLRLGWKERALALLAWLVEDQRPSGWRQWPEVSRPDRRAPGFLGDLPHGWIASTYVRTVRRLIVDERGDDETLVLLAGVPEVWVRDPPGLRVHGLPTRHGVLDLTAHADDAGVHLRFGARPTPPGGLVVECPTACPVRDAVVDGRACAVEDGRRLRLAAVPREIVLRY